MIVELPNHVKKTQIHLLLGSRLYKSYYRWQHHQNVFRLATRDDYSVCLWVAWNFVLPLNEISRIRPCSIRWLLGIICRRNGTAFTCLFRPRILPKHSNLICFSNISYSSSSLSASNRLCSSLNAFSSLSSCPAVHSTWSSLSLLALMYQWTLEIIPSVVWAKLVNLILRWWVQRAINWNRSRLASYELSQSFGDVSW